MPSAINVPIQDQEMEMMEAGSRISDASPVDAWMAGGRDSSPKKEWSRYGGLSFLSGDERSLNATLNCLHIKWAWNFLSGTKLCSGTPMFFDSWLSQRIPRADVLYLQAAWRPMMPCV